MALQGRNMQVINRILLHNEYSGVWRWLCSLKEYSYAAQDAVTCHQVKCSLISASLYLIFLQLPTFYSLTHQAISLDKTDYSLCQGCPSVSLSTCFNVVTGKRLLVIFYLSRVYQHITLRIALCSRINTSILTFWRRNYFFNFSTLCI